jgi:hypothetical protein
MSKNSSETLVLGAKPLGITKKVTTEIIRSLRDQLERNDRSVTVKSIRFIPSSRSVTESGAFQVIAHTVFDAMYGTETKPHVEALESVVTVGRMGGSQMLEELSIPALRHRTS